MSVHDQKAQLELLLTELRIAKDLVHDNLVEFLGASWDPDERRLRLLMGYAEEREVKRGREGENGEKRERGREEER